VDYGRSVNPGLDLRVGGIENLRGEAEKYDLIIVNHVLEHLPDPKAAFACVRDSTAAGGLIYVGLPGLTNPRWYRSPTKSFLGALHIGHLFHFTETSFLTLAKECSPIHLDGSIRAVLEVPGRGSRGVCGPSEYHRNLAFIRHYENSLGGKWMRIKAVVEHLPGVLILVLPPWGIKTLVAMKRWMTTNRRPATTKKGVDVAGSDP
jgi:SAM-dependent methyltransferase